MQDHVLMTPAIRETTMHIRTLAAAALALLSLPTPPSLRADDAPKPIKVFILAGQSNMEGKAKASLLEYQAQQPATRDLFAHLRKDEELTFWVPESMFSGQSTAARQ